MSTRATQLAQRIEQGAQTLAAFAKGLTDKQWNTVLMPDGRQIGVIIHHVASVYPVEVHLASEMAAGKPMVGVTWEVIADMNAKHSTENGKASKEEAVELLLRNSKAAADAVRGLTDAQLDTAVTVSLYGDAPLTAQFFIEDHALRHSWHHLGKIRKALG
jgi:hypothetical protein